MPFFSEFLHKSICCGYSFELHRQVDAIQMGTHGICLYTEVAKQYTSCNPKSTELLDCALIGVCAVIRSYSELQIRWGIHNIFSYFSMKTCCGQGLTNPLSSCPGQVQIWLGKWFFYLTCPEKCIEYIGNIVLPSHFQDAVAKLGFVGPCVGTN